MSPAEIALSSTAPTMPGVRWPKGLMALKRWVALLAPAAL